MPIETIELPLKEAVALEAKQNRERDLRVMEEDDVDDFASYEAEAQHVLSTTGEGYQPEFPDHKLVKVKK